MMATQKDSVAVRPDLQVSRIAGRRQVGRVKTEVTAAAVAAPRRVTDCLSRRQPFHRLSFFAPKNISETGWLWPSRDDGGF